jgi:predicted nuclease of predicted toxin-antitoxin system
VKLFFDENLSHKLTIRLSELYPGSIHISEAGLLQSPDIAIWEYAKANNFVIVTADADFFELAANFGPPPKVVWLRRWGHTTRDAERLLRLQAVRITEFVADTELGVLVLDKNG